MVDPERVVHGISVAAFPLMVLGFLLLLLVDLRVYKYLLREDEAIEWLTAALLAVAALLAAFVGFRFRDGLKRHRWFFLIFAVFCLGGSLEEISWGQRVLGFDSPEFFLEHSDQRETNVHNVLQQRLGIKTKHVAGIVLFVYGVMLAWRAREPRFADALRALGIVAPPRSLIPGFFLASLMMFDWPTRQEEEIGEFFFSACLALFMIGELLRQRRREVRGTDGVACSGTDDDLPAGRRAAVTLAGLLPAVAGVVLAAILILNFGDSSIAGEGDLLTRVSLALLLSLAGVSVFIAALEGPGKRRLLWTLMGTACVFLALDEGLMLHERFDKWVHRVLAIEETPVTDQLDGVIVLAYVGAGAAFVAAYRFVLGVNRRALLYLCAAFSAGLLTCILDLLHTGHFLDTAYFEEAAKVIAEYLLLLAFVEVACSRGDRSGGEALEPA